MDVFSLIDMIGEIIRLIGKQIHDIKIALSEIKAQPI